jgi:hypothetical protein
MAYISATKEVVSEDLLRHMILNTIRSVNVKFRDTYGEMIIAIDHEHSWRKDVFQYYKAGRKVQREKNNISVHKIDIIDGDLTVIDTSDNQDEDMKKIQQMFGIIDWSQVYAYSKNIWQEIRDNFSYRVVYVENSEADDVIAVLTNNYKDKDIIMIISGDHDFVQLQVNPNVRQYDPIRKKEIKEIDPRRYLFEHICHGESKNADGIPNILSPDDIFMKKGSRQKPITKKMINDWYNFGEYPLNGGYQRNQRLIDFDMIPTDIGAKILTEYENQQGKKGNIYKYFLKKGLNSLMTNIQDF